MVFLTSTAHIQYSFTHLALTLFVSKRVFLIYASPNMFFFLKHWRWLLDWYTYCSRAIQCNPSIVAVFGTSCLFKLVSPLVSTKRVAIPRCFFANRVPMVSALCDLEPKYFQNLIARRSTWAFSARNSIWSLIERRNDLQTQAEFLQYKNCNNSREVKGFCCCTETLCLRIQSSARWSHPKSKTKKYSNMCPSLRSQRWEVVARDHRTWFPRMSETPRGTWVQAYTCNLRFVGNVGGRLRGLPQAGNFLTHRKYKSNENLAPMPYLERVTTRQDFHYFRLARWARTSTALREAQVVAPAKGLFARVVARCVLFERVAWLLACVVAARKIVSAFCVAKVERYHFAYR